MSYIDLESTKVPGPGRYDELRKNETPKWSMRPRTSTDRSFVVTQCFPKQLNLKCLLLASTTILMNWGKTPQENITCRIIAILGLQPIFKEKDSKIQVLLMRQSQWSAWSWQL